MTEKTIALVRILDRCNGSRRMLEGIVNEHPGLRIDTSLAKLILSGELEKAEIYRRVSGGLGIRKNHCSAMFPKKEGQLKYS